MTDISSDTIQSNAFTSKWWVAILIIVAFLLWQFWPRQVVSDNPVAPTVTHTPIVYAVDDWAISPKSNLLEATKQLGTVGTTDTGLDIHGQPSNITRFNSLSEPPLMVNISDEFVELSWYFAPATDSEHNKTISQNHAKKAHAFATALLGSSAHDTLKSMLTTPNQDFAKTPIHLATCKHYQCQLIIHKHQITTTP